MERVGKKLEKRIAFLSEKELLESCHDDSGLAELCCTIMMVVCVCVCLCVCV